MFLHGQARQTKPGPFSHPAGAHLQYFGGRIVSNIQVVQVLYGTGSYIPQVTSTSTPSMATFYQGVLNSPYVDWLTEYNTVGQSPPTSNQLLGRGAFSQQVQINPNPANNGTLIDDIQIQNELSAQIAAGTLPPPTHDAAGNNNTWYAINFPHGKTISLGGALSCQVFCAYHGTIENAGGQGEITYGVLPDFQPGSGCENGCGAAATQFGNYTQVASHEMIETMTDPEVGLAQVFGPPLAWADLVFSEIGDICNDQNGQVVGADGVTYDVQTEFSNSVNDCIVTNAAATPVTATSAGETCRGTTAMATVTVLGGAGRFTSPVTLSVTGVSPTPPSGGEITATFDPDPVPTPPTNGATSTMRIASTPLTPPGTYTLTIQAASAELTRTTTTQVVIRSQVPGGPTLTSPANGADGVAQAATFTWSPVDQATQYELDVFDGSDCTGKQVRTFTTGNTSFTIPQAQALATFENFSWHVSAANSCGSSATSACFNFRTASCSDPQEAIANGGFENGFGSWSIDATVPPPVIEHTIVHSGGSSALLGTVVGTNEPLGDTQISQTLTLSTGSTPTLSFWEWPLTTDSVTFDQQYVRVQPISPPGPVVVLMNEARNDQTFIRREFDLSQFAGSTVKLIFGVHQDGFGDITGMFVDDISVTTQNCGPPDFKITLTPLRNSEVCAGQSVQYSVAVDSVNGPNFTSTVTLSAGSLPPGATATFANNPVSPGGSTTLTVTTARPTNGSQFTITVNGVADKPPPDGTRSASTPLLIDPNAPNAPEIVSPAIGAINVPRRPTLSWTAPFVPDGSAISGGSTSSSSASSSGASASSPGSASGPAPALPVSKPGAFPWQLAGTMPPGSSPGGASAVTPFAFGASAYHLQIARDAAFSNIVVDTTTATTSFTVGFDLDIATQYFWRVTATNACGTSAFSTTGSFIVGACFEGWATGVSVPITNGPAQSTVIGSNFDNKLYVIGGGTGANPDVRIDEVWAFDPLTQAWTQKASVPSPGVGSNFGSAAQIGGAIYVFGGVSGPPGPITITSTAWKYDIAGNTWSRIADLPTTNFGAATAAIGGKIYLASGSGFIQQTWAYDPATNTYTRKADAPPVAQARMHAVVLGGEMHAVAGGFEGSAHLVYNTVTNSWRSAAPMPFTATDPAVGVVAGRAFVVGGRPTAHTQVYDPATDSWSQSSPIGLATGVDNTAGAVLGPTFHLVGGFNGTTSINTHQQFHTCSLGALSSAALVPFVVDGNGKKAGIGNEATALLLDNSISGTAMSVSCFLYGTSGNLLGNRTISVAAGELKTVTDVVRQLTGTSTVQNTTGSLQLFGTEVFQGMASVVNNASGDPTFVDGQPIAGSTNGWISTAGTTGYLTQTVFANASASTSVLQVLAYSAAGGSTPVAGTVAFIPAHGLVSYTDVVKQLGLGATYSGQISWSASQPIAVMARDSSKSKPNFNGINPVHGLSDTASTSFVSYVEDTTAFSSSLELSNPGPITANVTVRFVQTSDSTGASSGVEHSRDIPVAVNSGAPIADIVRWTQFSTATTPSGQHGFLVVTTPQGVTAQGRLVDRSSTDPATVDSGALTGGFSPLLIHVGQLPFSQVMGAAATPTTASRVALSNPGSAPITVNLTAFNATGSVAGTFSRTVAPDGQYVTEDLATAMGLPPVFLGWVQIQASGTVLVYNHRRTGTAGATVPVHAE